MNLQLAYYESPLGRIALVRSAKGLCAVALAERCERMRNRLRRRFGAVAFVTGGRDFDEVAALRAYFDGRLDALDALDVDAGGTAFQARVWEELQHIPAGQTVSYGELARMVGRGGAARAVGAANGANPVAIVVPCHRVVAAGGALGGYGGGLQRKLWLLQHEGAIRQNTTEGFAAALAGR